MSVTSVVLRSSDIRPVPLRRSPQKTGPQLRDFYNRRRSTTRLKTVSAQRASLLEPESAPDFYCAKVH
jgi:hypothetical protein